MWMMEAKHVQCGIAIIGEFKRINEEKENERKDDRFMAFC